MVSVLIGPSDSELKIDFRNSLVFLWKSLTALVSILAYSLPNNKSTSLKGDPRGQIEDSFFESASLCRVIKD